MQWNELKRVNFSAFRLDRRMIAGINKIVAVRNQERSGSKPEDVVFNREFILYWIRSFVLIPMQCKTLDELSSLLPELNNDEANQPLEQE